MEGAAANALYFIRRKQKQPRSGHEEDAYPGRRAGEDTMLQLLEAAFPPLVHEVGGRLMPSIS